MPPARSTSRRARSSATITLTVRGDNIAEPRGLQRPALEPAGAGDRRGTGTVAITDDDVAAPPPAAPTLKQLSVQDATTTEDRKNTTATITVTLSEASSSAITVTVKTKLSGSGNGHAGAGGDFLEKTATVTFARARPSPPSC